MAKDNNRKVAATPKRTTSEKLQELLELLKINVVYYVDDENNLSDFDVQIAIGEIAKIYGLQKEAELAAIELPNWDRSLPQDESIESLRKEWPNITFENKKELYRKVLKISNGEDLQLDFKRATLVAQQIPAGVIKVLSPSEWDIERKTLATKLKEDERALILFDEELKFAGGRFVLDKGQDLIVEVKKMGVNDNVICTLLTHKISNANEELKFRNDLIDQRTEKDLSVDDFFPLAKQRLDEAEVFADGIKKALMNRYFETIKKHTVEIIEYSYGEAVKKIKEFDTYDFEATILKTSVKDGVWEPETIVRIGEIVFGNEIKKQMVDRDYAPKVNKELKSCEKFSGIEFDQPVNVQPYSDKLFLRHQELYDAGDIINALRKPLENGDIFQIGSAQYILVSQACDMAVRKKGDIVGVRTAKIATLLKISSITQEKLKKELKGSDHYFSNKFLLNYFNSGTTDKGIVDFTDYLIVDIDFLDLCVFNGGGSCNINLLKLDSVEYLSRIWEQRYQILIKKVTDYAEKISEVRKSLQPRRIARGLELIVPGLIRRLQRNIDTESIVKEFYPKFILASSTQMTNTVKVKGQTEFDFGARRIAKYKNYGATYLLERYTRHLSRIAEPHDFAASKV